MSVSERETRARERERGTHVRSAAVEAPRPARSTRTARAAPTRPAEPAALPRRVLVGQVRVLGLVRLAKVALLHDGGEGRHVDGRLGRGGVVALVEELGDRCRVGVEHAAVVVPLQEGCVRAREGKESVRVRARGPALLQRKDAGGAEGGDEEGGRERDRSGAGGEEERRGRPRKRGKTPTHPAVPSSCPCATGRPAACPPSCAARLGALGAPRPPRAPSRACGRASSASIGSWCNWSSTGRRRKDRKRDARVALLAVALEALQLAQLPRLELALGVEPVRVVDVRVHVLRLLCGQGLRQRLDRCRGSGSKEKGEGGRTVGKLAHDAGRDEVLCLLAPAFGLGRLLRLNRRRVELLLLRRDRVAVAPAGRTLVSAGCAAGGEGRRRRERGDALGDEDGLVQRLEGLFLLRVGLVLARLQVKRWARESARGGGESGRARRRAYLVVCCSGSDSTLRAEGRLGRCGGALVLAVGLCEREREGQVRVFTGSRSCKGAGPALGE